MSLPVRRLPKHPRSVAPDEDRVPENRRLEVFARWSSPVSPFLIAIRMVFPEDTMHLETP